MPRDVTRRLLLAVLLGAAVPGRAAAHGQSPEALELLLRPGHPDEVVLATSFGLVVSRDGGQSWELVCEEAFGSYTVNRYALGADGALFAASVDGLFVSDGSGCRFSAAGGAIAGHNVLDVAPDPSDARRVLALGTRLDDAGVPGPPALFESRDGGATFITIEPLPGGIFPSRLRLAGDGGAIYIVGFAEESGVPSPRLVVRAPRAPSFTVVDLRALAPDDITDLAVHPLDSAQVFFTTTGPRLDRLYGSLRGGAEPRAILEVEDELRGLALDETGATLYVVRKAGRTLFRSVDSGGSWTAILGGPHYRCLAVRAGGLWACADWASAPAGDGYAVGQSLDQGETWQAALRFPAVVGAAAPCLGARCSPSADWLCSYVCAQSDGGLGGGEARPAREISDAAVPDAPEGPADGSAAPRDGIEHPGTGDGSGGCSCTVGAAGGRTHPVAAATLAGACWYLLMTAGGRRRRRARPGC